MTPVLLILTFLLVLDMLVLLGRSYDSRDGRDCSRVVHPGLTGRPGALPDSQTPAMTSMKRPR